MFGFRVFYNVFINLNVIYKNRVLGNIFNIAGVSASNVSLLKDGISFKLFSNGFFYNYVFMVGNGVGSKIIDNRISKIVVYIDTADFVMSKYNFIRFLWEAKEEVIVYRLLMDYI